MKNNKFKKGFTLTELIIVIVIIGVLAGVLIPTFTSVISKANKSADIQTVRQLNMLLTADKASQQYSKHKTMHDVIEVVEEGGYKTNNIKASVKGNEILWDQINDIFCYINNGERVYIPETLAEEVVPYDASHMHLFWKVYNNIPSEQTYSIYWDGNGVADINVKVGFDAGDADDISSVNYIGADTVKERVIIRTNSDTTDMSVKVFEDGTCDTVYHYNKANTVTIIDSGDASYHELGNVARIDANEGHVVIENGAKVTTIISFDGDKVVIDNNGGDIISACGEGHTTNTGNVNLISFVADEVDLRFIEKLNAILALSQHNNMTEALDDLDEEGYGINRINALIEGHDILWDQTNDVFCYFDGENIIYNDEVSTSYSVGDYHLWKIYKEMPENQTYSIYWNGLGVPSFEIEVGFDAGKKATAIRIDYNGTESTKEDVIIRTCGGTLVLNKENDTILHYGIADVVLTRAGTYVQNGAAPHAKFSPSVVIGSRYTTTPSRQDRMQISEKGIFLKAGTIIQLIDTSFDYQVGKLNKTGEDTYTLNKWDGVEWKYDSPGKERRFKISEDGYYTLNFRNHANTSKVLTSDVETFKLEDVIDISYNPELSSPIGRVSSIETIAMDRFHGYLELELVLDGFFPSSSQDGYIYDGKAYISNSSTNTINIVNLSDGTSAGTMSYDDWSNNKVHGNVVHLREFENQYYTYSNIYNSYQNNENKRFGECCVYLTDLTNTSEKPMELVQILKVGFTDDETKWPQWTSSNDRPYGNFLIDEENNILYVYVMDSVKNVTKWFKFNLPDPTAYNEEGNVYVLSYESLLDSWETTYMNNMQGATICNGLIYSLEGKSGEPGIRVIDPVLKAELININVNQLDSYKSEPEFIAYYDGYLYYGAGDHKLYKLFIR